MKRIELKLRNQWAYAGYYALNFMVGATALYCIFAFCTDTKNIYIYFLTWGFIELLRTLHMTRIKYVVIDNYLHIRRPHMLIKTIPLEAIAQLTLYSRPHYRIGELYTLRITLQNGKNYYLYPKSTEQFISLLKKDYPDISIAEQ